MRCSSALQRGRSQE
uniref:Uncharacterized protein n=1 Tax=Arundo donax TaxID=35708 RepID=A0A0A9G2B0_ARUDO